MTATLQHPHPATTADDNGGRLPPDDLVARTLATAGAVFGLSADELSGPDRSRHTVHARQVAAYLLRKGGLSFPAIGRALGGRDHTTVMHAVTRLCARMAESPALRATVEELADRVGAELTAAQCHGERADRLARAATTGAAAVVHRRLSPTTASAFSAAGFTRLADTGLCEVWVLHRTA